MSSIQQTINDLRAESLRQPHKWSMAYWHVTTHESDYTSVEDGAIIINRAPKMALQCDSLEEAQKTAEMLQGLGIASAQGVDVVEGVKQYLYDPEQLKEFAGLDQDALEAVIEEQPLRLNPERVKEIAIMDATDPIMAAGYEADLHRTAKLIAQDALLEEMEILHDITVKPYAVYADYEELQAAGVRLPDAAGCFRKLDQGGMNRIIDRIPTPAVQETIDDVLLDGAIDKINQREGSDFRRQRNNFRGSLVL